MAVFAVVGQGGRGGLMEDKIITAGLKFIVESLLSLGYG
jgi:hypothetical protein